MPLTVVTCTIPAGESLSDAGNASNGKLQYICMPDDWTEAPITFRLSPDGDQWFDMFDLKAEEISIKFSPDGICYLADFVTFDRVYIQVRSGWRDSPVPQENARAFLFAFE